MSNAMLLLWTLWHPAVTPTACVMTNLTSNVTNFANITADVVAQTVAQQLRRRGWTVLQTMDDSDDWYSCKGEYIVEISGSAVHASDIYAFTIVVCAYEKMDSRHRSNWNYWSEHHNHFGVWTADATEQGRGQSQFMSGVDEYVGDVADAVEREPTGN